MLLSPIARLLGISLDTLLAFKSDLTPEEINEISSKADGIFKTGTYEEAFQFIKKQLEKYPNCDMLIWQLTLMLEAKGSTKELDDEDKYDEFIVESLTRVLGSDKEKLRCMASELLYNHYLRKGNYEEAENCLKYLSEQNPEKKRKLAVIYSKTGRVEDAYRMYEELLMADWQMTDMVIQDLYVLALQENDLERAGLYVEKKELLAKLFEMGKYHESYAGLELAVFKKDADAVIKIIREMLSSVEDIGAFTRSRLYEHMKFKKLDSEFTKEVKSDLIRGLLDGDDYAFLRGNQEWEKLFDELKA